MGSKKRNISEAVLRPQYAPCTLTMALLALLSILHVGHGIALILAPRCIL